jgi:hypothetical protein
MPDRTGFLDTCRDYAQGVTRAALLAAVVSLLAVPAAGAGNEGAGVFMTRILREEIHGQWGLQWSELHPAHQKLISRAQYVACSREMGTDFATGDEIFRVLDVRDEPLGVKGVPQKTAKRVTINFHEPGKAGLTYQLHAVRVQDRWAWILGGRFLTAVTHGRCLDGKPLIAKTT